MNKLIEYLIKKGMGNFMDRSRDALAWKADDERNLDLICWVKEILDEFASTHNCPLDWRHIGAVLAVEYPADSWVYENLELYNFTEGGIK